ncbi:MAG: hypothetical protein IH961_09035, partial [Chloroflexi bacterium]|nr:hypothetical protein [Chloroflexota bacterium]
MKLSAKLVTALAAIVLLVVALTGVAQTTQASHDGSEDHVNGTVTLDDAWYTVGDTITITVNDS